MVGTTIVPIRPQSTRSTFGAQAPTLRYTSPVKQPDFRPLTDSLALLPEQLAAGWGATADVRLPSSLRSARAVVVAGMGGSNLGAQIASSVFASVLQKPITVHADYGLPRWVGKETLVVASSYSGSTEEAVSTYREAKKRRLPLVVLTGGGTLKALAIRDQVPMILFPTETNPSGQPRFGVGLSFGAFAHLLVDIGALPTATLALPKLVASARKVVRSANGWAGPTSKMLIGNVPVFLGAEHLVGNLHTAANQFNENAKTVALWFALPDLNHHLLEGLSQPREVVRRLVAVGFDSPNYSERNRKRLRLTLSIFKKRGAKTLTVRPVGATRLDEALFTLAWGGAVSLALARATKQKPQNIPWVEYFKKQLA